MTPNEAIDALMDLSEATASFMDADGNTSFEVNEDLPIEVREHDNSVELRATLVGLSASDPAQARMLLEAGLLGEGTGHGRFAKDAEGGDAVLLIDKVDPQPMTQDQLEHRFAEFLQYVAYWMTQGEDDALAATARAQAEKSAARAAMTETIIRA